MRPAEQPRRAWAQFIAPAVILIAAAVVRLPLVEWGLPNTKHYFSYHPDEIFLLLPSFGFAQGDWNPHFFNYGTLYIYLVGLPAMLLGTTQSSQFPTNLSPLYELGRMVSLTMGVATVGLVMVPFWRKQRGLGLLSGALLAICPLHVMNSGFATVDVTATFFITLAFVLALRGAEKADVKWGAAVGMAVGLAAATKYNAGLFIVPAMLAPLVMTPRRWRWGWCAASMGGAALGFVIGCPYFWTEKFRQGLLFEVQHARIGGTLAFVDTGNGWGYHLIHGLPVGLGYALLLAVIVGVIAAVRAPFRPTRLSLLWIVFYLLAIGFGKERFIRYLVPLTPFLCVVAAFGLGRVVGLTRSNLSLFGAVAAAAAVVALTGLYWIGGMLPLAVIDVRDYIGLQSDYPVNGGRLGLVEAPWYSDPPVSPYNAGPFSRGVFEEWNQRNGSRVVVTGWDAARLRAERPDVFFLSDVESQDLLRLKRPEAVSLVAALGGVYKSRHMFSDFGTPFDWLGPPLAWAPPDWRYLSPRITMYYDPR